MVDATGNVLRPPGTSQVAETTDDEILASYSRLNQKGVTLKQTASTVYPAGMVLKVSSTAKKYDAATKAAGLGGTPTVTVIGILRKQVDVSDSDALANVVFGGVVKGAKIQFSDDTDGLSASELADLAGKLGGRYDAVHDQVIF